jgi:hypothetical protein
MKAIPTDAHETALSYHRLATDGGSPTRHTVREIASPIESLRQERRTRCLTRNCCGD